jgi:Flp pilus assembly protein protease CpaA
MKPVGHPTEGTLTIGTSLFLIAVGAILKFAVTAHVEGIDIQTVGVILMIVGLVGLVLSLYLFARSRWTAPGPPHAP